MHKILNGIKDTRWKKKIKGNWKEGGRSGVAWWGWNKLGAPRDTRKGLYPIGGLEKKRKEKSTDAALFNNPNYRITSELTATAQEAKRDCDSSHVTWKSDLDIMSLKGNSSRGLISLSEVHLILPPGSTLRTPTTHRRCAPTSFGKSKPIICDASPLKDQGTLPLKEVSKSH
ncbi:hypothetical protein CEXT_123161 [Caerostris extrusa]|uniref:Uncharacterized protein n=1 Tax=Caerostris extrusa TaxID=172846 RepID=A0AAV4XUE1_CAEEX|nr:hypothetical protein CEXT_123161 [Caerostris extrusa]